MPSPLLLGFCGPKQSGKTLAAELLMHHHGVLGMGFAQPLRVFIAELLGYTAAELEANKETPVPWLEGATPRTMLQTLGTEWGRNLIHPDLWVRVAMKSADRARAVGHAVVFADVRFPNEAAAIKDRGGYILRIERDAAANSGDAHVSEAGLPPEYVHATIPNNGTPQELYDGLREVLVGLRARRALAEFTGD